MAIKLYYNKTTYQFITLDDGGESIVVGDDGGKEFHFYFGTGTSLVDYVNDATIPVDYLGRVVIERPDGDVSNELYLTPVVADGYFKLIVSDWISQIEGNLEFTTRLKVSDGAGSYTVYPFTMATIPVEAGVTPGDDTIEEAQYQAIMDAVDGVVAGTTDIVYDNVGTEIVAVTVQDAITELDSDISDLKDGTSEFTIVNIGGALLKFNETQDVVEIEYDDGTTGQLNKELWAGVRNEDSSIMLNGEVVAVNGVVGQQMSAIHADPSDEALHFKEIGVVTMTDGIAVNAIGKVTRFGEVNGIPVANFENTGTAYAENQELFVSVNGKLTNVAPSALIAHVHVGWVLRIVGSTANIFVDFIKVPHLDHLSDVSITSPATGDILVKNASGVYVNSQRLVTVENKVTTIENKVTTVENKVTTVENNKATDFSVIDDNKYPTVEAVKEQLDLKESLANKGQPNGYPDLDESGKVPLAQTYATLNDLTDVHIVGSTPYASDWLSETAGGSLLTPTSGNWYHVVTAGEYEGESYRWSGSAYVLVSSDLILGETSNTAYRGDRGKTAYDHSQVTDGSNPHNTTFANIESKPTTIAGYGITDAYDKAYIDALQDNNGWEQTDLTPTALTNGQTLVTATLQGYDEVRFVCRNTSTNEVDTDVIVGQLLTENTKIIFFDDANVYFLVGATNSTFTENASFELKVFGVTMTQQEAENINFDNTESGLTATNVQDAIDELEDEIDAVGTRIDGVDSDIDDLEQKDVIQDSRINQLEENLRKSYVGDSAVASGTDIISLGKDVANAPLNVLVEGGLLDAPQLVTNGDFDTNTTGWLGQGGTVSWGSGGFGLITGNATSNSILLYRDNETITNVSDKMYQAHMVRVTNSVCSSIQIIFDGSTGGTDKTVITQNSPVQNQWYLLSVVNTLPSDATGLNRTKIQHNYVDSATASGKVMEHDYIYRFNISTLISNKQYSPIYDTTFDLMSDAQIKAQMDAWVQDGTLPNDIMAVNMNKRVRSVGKNLFDKNVSLGIGIIVLATGLPNVSDLRYVYNNYIKITGTSLSARVDSGFVIREAFFYGEQFNYIGYATPATVSNIVNYTIPSNSKYVRLHIRNAGATNLTSSDILSISNSLQLELGSTATTYQPYVSSDLYLQANRSGYEYQGTRDSIVMRNGKAYFISRVNDTLDGLRTTPIETEILAIGNAQGIPNATVYIDDIKWATDIYTTNITVTTAISQLVSITKMNADGSETQLAVSGATVAGDGLSFTHTGLTSGDAVRFTYIPQGDYFKSNTDILYFDNPLIAVDSVTSTVYKLVPTIANGVLTWTIVGV